MVWSNDGAPTHTGRLIASETCLELHGDGESVFIEGSVLANARAASYGERLNGRPTIVLERRDGTIVRIGALEFAVVGELLDQIAALPDGSRTSDRALIVVPLRKGSREKALDLVAQGPPFDLQATGLTRHEVFVSDDRAIFLLEGPRIDETVERLLHDVSVWRTAVAWRSCLAGRPTLANPAYSWTSEGHNP